MKRTEKELLLFGLRQHLRTVSETFNNLRIGNFIIRSGTPGA